MKLFKLLILLFLFTLFIHTPAILWSQIINNTLSYNKGNVYDSRMNSLDYSQVKYFMKGNAEALSYMQKAQLNKTIWTGVGITGLAALAVGIVVGEASMQTNQVDDFGLFLTLLGSGTALSVVGIFIQPGYKKNVKKAVDIYNSDITKIKPLPCLFFSFGVTENGPGVIIRF